MVLIFIVQVNVKHINMVTMIVDCENSYRALQTCTEFKLVYDATSHWIKELNTIFQRGTGKDGIIYKPVSFRRVSSSHTGEALCKELIEKISIIISL